MKRKQIQSDDPVSCMALENGSQMKISCISGSTSRAARAGNFETARTTPMEALGGEFAIQTYLKGRYLTAVGGGGRSTDVIHIDAVQLRAWEKFKFWSIAHASILRIPDDQRPLHHCSRCRRPEHGHHSQRCHGYLDLGDVQITAQWPLLPTPSRRLEDSY